VIRRLCKRRKSRHLSIPELHICNLLQLHLPIFSFENDHLDNAGSTTHLSTTRATMPSNESGISTSPNGPALEGIHVPSLTFFTSSAKQEIDWETQNKHLRFLISSGVHGVVLAGTNGEAITLSRAEKSELVRATRQAAQDLGKPELPICLGTSGTSTRDVLDDCVAAKEAGANFALVLVPSFFHFAMTKDAVCEFFEEVADASSVPIIIYNFPGVAAGLNVDSTMLDRLAKHENIVGVKVRADCVN
jgi:4-hydroxy-2-oxoglutarate aldolase